MVCGFSAGLAEFVFPFASSWPDGLERVAGAFGFESKAVQPSVIPSPLPDYSIPGLHSAIASTVLTGIIGLNSWRSFWLICWHAS